MCRRNKKAFPLPDQTTVHKELLSKDVGKASTECSRSSNVQNETWDMNRRSPCSSAFISRPLEREMMGKRHVWSDPLQPSSSSADSHLLLLKWNKFQCSNKSPSIFLRLIHQRCHFHHVESYPSPIGICYAYLTSKVCFARRRESAGSYFIHTSSSLHKETLRQFWIWRLMLWHRIGSNRFIFCLQYICSAKSSWFT